MRGRKQGMQQLDKMFCKGVAHEHLLLGEGQLAVRFWSSGVHGLHLATFPSVTPSCQLHCHFPMLKASLASSTQARDNGFPGVSEDYNAVSTKKKERLSRQERAAVVESFVQKYMETHQGAFPSVSSVLRSTGGGRNVVKKILTEIEDRFAQTNLTKMSTDSSSIKNARNKDDVQVSESFSEDEEEEYSTSGNKYELEELNSVRDENAEDEGEDEDANDEFAEFDTPADGTYDRQEAENVTYANDQMTGSSQEELEAHSRLSSRLRGMGMSNTLQQLSGAQGTSRRSGLHLPRQEYAISERTKGNGRTPDSMTFSSTNPSEGGPRNATYHEGRFEELSETESKERHGLFVRYLSCQATAADLRDAFADCGDIIRAYAIKARPNVKYTYGFVDFKTFEGLQKALGKKRVYIRGVRILTEPSTTPSPGSSKTMDDSQTTNAASADIGIPQAVEKAVEKAAGRYLGVSKARTIGGCGYKVSVKGIPMNIPLSDVQGALSKYGEIVLSDMKQENIGTYSANLEFKAVDARDRALSAKSVQLHGLLYSIHKVSPLKTSVVRLSNIGIEPNVDQIGATCELFGRVEKVVARCDSSVDVYFLSSEVENIPRILSRLNEVTMDGLRWQAQSSACIGSDSYESLLETRDGQEWLQLESERRLTEIESALRKLVVNVEDLQELVKANRFYLGTHRNSGNSIAR